MTRREPQPMRSADLPSVAALARLFNAVYERKNIYDRECIDTEEGSLENQAARAAFEHADNEADAIMALIFTSPIITTTDAVALALFGRTLAEGIEGAAERAGLTAEVDNLQCAFSRIAVAISSNLGVDLTEFRPQCEIDMIMREVI